MTTKTRQLVFAATTCVLTWGSCNAVAVTVDLADDFQGGTPQNWGHGSTTFNVPSVVNSGGPNGDGDGYLRIRSTGSAGPASRLLALNRDQWTGDYVDLNIRQIIADLRNPTDMPLSIRLSFESLGQRLTSTEPVVLGPNSGWLPAVFPIGAANLTGAGDYNTVLGNVTELRILHNSLVSHQGESVAAEFHVDNLTAQTVPEPSTFVLAGFCLVGLGNYRGSRQQD